MDAELSDSSAPPTGPCQKKSHHFALDSHKLKTVRFRRCDARPPAIIFAISVGFAHLAFGVVLTLASWRALEQAWLPNEVGDDAVVATLRLAIPSAALAGSALSLIAGRISGDPGRALRGDALSSISIFVAISLLALGGNSRDAIGLILVLAVAARLVPSVWWVMRFSAPPLFIFALCLAFYAPLAGWRVAASLPFGDQVFYLMSADRVAHGSLDATIDPTSFRSLVGVDPAPVDAATHVAGALAGPRLVQGYALPALLAPGWMLAGQLGATIVVAIFAAWAAMQTWLLLGETIADRRAAGITWALMAFCAPLALAAVHVYPNAIGAALVVTGYRCAFTARHRRAALAGALLGATAFLNPRDGLVLVALAPFVLRWQSRDRIRAIVGAGALVLAAAVVSLVTFGVPLPYAGYLFGTAAAQTIQAEPTWTFRFWIGLPAILFDRVFGIAGTAPWMLVAALGAAQALRVERARLLPAAVAAVASVVLLSFFRLWEGGYAPPNRYVVDVLPLITPFVAFGLAAARGPILRTLVAITIGTSALVSAFLFAVPTAALNTAFEDKPQSLLAAALGIDPLGWLPSFQPVTPDWWVGAYLRLVPAVALVAVLAWIGARKARA